MRKESVLAEATFDLAVAIAPTPKFFDDPGRESNRRVV
jgi:hypothetical protein